MTTHAKISYAKSVLRLVGYGIGMGMGAANISHHMGFFFSFFVLAVAEIVGIIEEFGE